MNKKLGLFAFFLVSGMAVMAQMSSNVRYIYDEAEQLIGVIDENNNAMAYRYDAAGNLIAIERLTARGAVDIFFVEPNRGRAAVPPQPGTPVTIHGVGFSTMRDQNQVTFNGVAAVVDSSTTTMIKTSVPAGATTGPVRVTVGAVTATSRSDFIVLNINVTVSPASVDLRAGQRQQFTATLTEGGTVISGNVVWNLSPAVGTIDRNGLYTAPSRSALARTVTVTATSVEELAARGTAMVNIAPSGIGPIYTPGASYAIARPPLAQMAIAPIYTPGASYRITRPESAQMALAPIFTPGASYRIARPESAQITLAPIFTPGASYTSVTITGLSPSRAARGTANLSITVTGTNFNGATALDFLLPSGVIDSNITVANLTVSADGTQITATISVASAAAVGARTAVVRTPTGPSTTMATGNNQLVIE